MGLEYLQLFADMEQYFEPYSDAERGRLTMAMMAYAFRGEEPTFDGNERFIWPILRNHIDRCAQNVEAKKANGSKGGRPAKGKTEEKQTKPEETKKNLNKANESEEKLKNHTHDYDHEYEYDHDHEKENDNNARATAAQDDDQVIGIDGQDLSSSIRMNAEVDALLRTYRLSEAVRGDLLDDIEHHGLEKIKAVLNDAAKADTRGGLSFNFYRACLANHGKPKPARAAPGKAENDMMRYTPEERKATYSAAILDFDKM